MAPLHTLTALVGQETVAGQFLRDLRLGEEVLLVATRRGEQTIVPSGGRGWGRGTTSRCAPGAAKAKRALVFLEG